MQYTERLLTGGSCLTRFSHRGRYQVVWNILASSRYERAVDFGCADGWFLKTAYERGIVRTGIGVDLDCNMLEAGSKKFEAIDGFRFIRPAEITSDLSGTCDLAICTETLEHVRAPKEIIDQM